MITKYQKAAGVEKLRNEIKLADYNPRQITPYARKKLKQSIKDFGMLEPFIWNETTGNLVGGHQRISVIDELEGNQTYGIAVTVVNLPIEKEKALNIALNNQAMQGEYDVSLIDQMLKNNEFDISLAGLCQVDLEMMYLNAGLETDILDTMFSDEGAEEINRVATEVDHLQEQIDQTKKEELVERRKEFSEKAARENENDFFFTVYFPSNADKHAFLKRAGFDVHSPHIDGYQLAEACGIDIFIPQEES